MAVKTVLKKARVNYSGYSPQEVAGFGGALVKSIQDRLLEGKDKYDRPMPPLTKSYALAKGRRFPPPIRNMKKTGKTFDAMGVLSANQNGAKVGISDGNAQRKINAQKEAVWGSSPRNSADLAEAISKTKFPAKVEQS